MSNGRYGFLTLVVTFCLFAMAAPQRAKANDDLSITSQIQLDIELTEQELAFIKSNPVISLTDDAYHKAYLFKDGQGQHRGLIIDLLAIVTANTGLKFEIKNLPLRQAVREVRAKSVDGVAITATTDYRTDILDYSVPYLSGHMAIFTKKGNSHKFRTLQDLNGKRIVITGSAKVLEQFAESIPYVQIVVVESAGALIQALATGKADYAYYPEVLNLIAHNNGEPLIEEAFLTGNVINLRFGLRNDMPELRTIVNKVLMALTPQNRNTLENKWLDPRFFSNLDEAVNLTHEELGYLQKRVGVRYCVNPNGGVISSINDEGQAVGMAAEFLTLLRSKLASNFVLYRTKSWQQTLQALEQGKCDMAPVIISTPNRRKYLDFSSPYLSDPAVVVTPKGQYQDFQLDRHLDKTYAITKGYALKEQLTSLYPDIKLLETATTAQCLSVVGSEGVAGCIAVLADAANHIYEAKIKDVEFHHRLGFNAEIRIGTRNSEPLLASIMQKTLNKLSRDDIRVLQTKYFNASNEPFQSHMTKLFYLGGLIIIVLVGVLAVFLLRSAKSQMLRSREATSLATQQLALMKFVADNSEQTVIAVTKDKAKITFINEYGCSSLGYDQRQATQLTLFDIDTQLTDEMWRAVITELQNTDHVLVRAAYKNKLAFIYPTELVYRKFNDGNEELIVVYVTDISSRVRIENELAESKQQVATAVALKDTFLGEIGSEVRMPTEFIIDMASLALETRLTKTQREYVHRVKVAGESIVTTLDDIHDYSLLSDGKLHLHYQEFDLVDLIDSMVSRFEFQTTQKSLELLSHCAAGLGRYYVGDIERLRQVLTKLVHNAIKYTEAGQIFIKVEEPESDRIQISVKDTGIGMAKDTAATLFEEKDFDTDTHSRSSIELSLSLSKKLVSLMDGEIWVESVKGYGSEFFINIYLPRATDLLTVEEFGQKNVLLVDDNPVCQKLMLEQLKHFQLQVEVAESGQKALHMVSEQPTKYDLVLMDWNMPDLNGIETTQLMHQQFRVDQSMSEYEPPTVIMVSAHDQAQMVKEARDIGSPLFLPKPVDPSSLFDVLVKVLVRSERFGDQPHRRNEVIKSLKQKLAYKTAKRVLLAEDNKINQEIVIGILEGCNIDIEIANNGKEALDLFDPKVHDLILMDLQMPVMDGFEATQQIRMLYPDIPIVALTANVMPEHVRKTQSLGMNAHLGKPVNIEKLYEILLMYLGETELENASNLSELPQQNQLLPLFNSINTHKGMTHFVNNTNLYRSALISFAEKYQNLDFDALSEDEKRQTIHSIKGLSDNIGADKLQHAVMEFEFDDKQEAKKYFLAELKVVIDEIKRHRSVLRNDDS